MSQKVCMKVNASVIEMEIILIEIYSHDYITAFY